MKHARGFSRKTLLCIALLIVLSSGARAEIFIQPYLQMPGPTGMTVLWWTDEAHEQNVVQYGRAGLTDAREASSEYVPSMKKHLHSASLSGLQQGTGYRYRVKSGSHASPEYSFRTAPAFDSSFRVVLLGDGRTDNNAVVAAHRSVAKRAFLFKPDLAFEIGDIVAAGTADHWARFYRNIVTASDSWDPGCEIASRVPFHLAVGNHEIWDGRTYKGGNLNTSMARFKALAHNPGNGSSNPHWNERYYVLRFGCATFIVLDTNNTSADGYDNHYYLEDGDTPDWDPSSEQYAWMIRELGKACGNSAFTFVLFHPSPYTKGVHGEPLDAQTGYQIRSLEGVFRHYGVDAVISSHDHTVERVLTGPPGPIRASDQGDPRFLNWLVQGNSGESARPAVKKWRIWLRSVEEEKRSVRSMYFYDWANTEERSFLDLAVRKTDEGRWRATFRTVQADGDVFDEFSLERSFAPAEDARE